MPIDFEPTEAFLDEKELIDTGDLFKIELDTGSDLPHKEEENPLFNLRKVSPRIYLV